MASAYLNANLVITENQLERCFGKKITGYDAKKDKKVD